MVACDHSGDCWREQLLKKLGEVFGPAAHPSGLELAPNAVWDDSGSCEADPPPRRRRLLARLTARTSGDMLLDVHLVDRRCALLPAVLVCHTESARPSAFALRSAFLAFALAPAPPALLLPPPFRPLLCLYDLLSARPSHPRLLLRGGVPCTPLGALGHSTTVGPGWSGWQSYGTASTACGWLRRSRRLRRERVRPGRAGCSSGSVRPPGFRSPRSSG